MCLYMDTSYEYSCITYIYTICIGEPEPSYYIYDGLQVVSAATGVGSYTQRTEYDMHRYHTTLCYAMLYYNNVVLYYTIFK